MTRIELAPFLARERHRPAVLRDDLARDVEPDPHAAVVVGRVRVCAIEALEDAILLRARDPDTVIADADDRLSLAETDRDVDAPAAW
jgi:hypothetical protein